MPFRKVLENNRRWVEEQKHEDPAFFRRMVGQHHPKFLWIGCSDARVPADVISRTTAGEMFVHRNIANQVVPTDVNLLAVLQYAVDVLEVHDIIVCGHEGCGGVKAALDRGAAPPLVEQWIAQIRTVARLHEDELNELSVGERWMKLAELNVAEQVYNLARTSIIQSAWARGAELRLHGWVYDLSEGLLRDLKVTLDGHEPRDAAEPPRHRAERPPLDLADRRFVAEAHGD